MKSIEEFKVSGKYGDEALEGSVTTYPNNLKNAKNKGVKTSIITSWEKFKEKTIKPEIFNKELTKKVGAALIVGAISLGSLTGCNIVPKANSQVVEYGVPNYESFDVRLNYTVKKGDTLMKIVSKYTPVDQLKEKLEETAKLNNLTDMNLINEGMVLSLNVPISSTQLMPDEYFEFIWGAKINFFRKVFSIPAERVHPGNKLFWSVKEEVEQIIEDTHIARADLHQMMEEKEIYGEYRIREQQMRIDLMFEEAINRTEIVSGINYYNTDAIEQYNTQLMNEQNQPKTMTK